MDTGRDLTLSSQQDSARHDSKQAGSSGGLSVAVSGTGAGGSLSLSLSRDNIHSDYGSVQEQTGIFAGNGGVDISTGGHTQLDGAVIASTAAAEKNRLETGTLGWRAIHNQADYKTEHQGGGISSGGLGDAGGSPLAGTGSNLAGNSTADAVAGAQAGKTTVENNYLSSKQIDAWSAEMKSCQAGGGDCGGIIKKYEELSTAQQKQLISDCASNPASCQQKYGDVLTDSLAVKQALDRAMGEDIPIKMVYDLTATWAHQMDADGIVASNKVSEQIMAKYGLDQAQADIIAGVALSALGG